MDHYRLKSMLEDELEKIVEKREITAGSLDAIDKLTHSLKSTNANICYDEEKDDYSGYSGTYRGMGGSYGNGGNGYISDYSGRRGGGRRRDSMGRYMSGGYSRGGSVKEQIQMMIDEGNMSAHEKRILEEAMEEMK